MNIPDRIRFTEDLQSVMERLNADGEKLDHDYELARALTEWFRAERAFTRETADAILRFLNENREAEKGKKGSQGKEP